MFSSSPLILPGQAIELPYPHHNIHGLNLEYVDRHLHVLSLEDFSNGLPIKWFLKQPLIRRGRLLLRGVDRDSLTHKSFWWESRKGGELMEHRLGLYDPDEPGAMPDWVGRIFGPTRNEQLRMRKVALKWLRLVRERGDVGMELALYPWPRSAGVTDTFRQ